MKKSRNKSSMNKQYKSLYISEDSPELHKSKSRKMNLNQTTQLISRLTDSPQGKMDIGREIDEKIIVLTAKT